MSGIHQWFARDNARCNGGLGRLVAVQKNAGRPQSTLRMDSRQDHCRTRCDGGCFFILSAGRLGCTRKTDFFDARRGVPARWAGWCLLLPALVWQPERPGSGHWKMWVFDVAQVGYLNRFGHPKQAVWNRWLATQATLWRTDQHGALLFESQDAILTVRALRTVNRRYWHHS